MNAPINNDEVLSPYGNLRPIYVPAHLGVDPQEWGRARAAWDYNLVRGDIVLLEYLADGLTNKELASELRVSQDTIKKKLKRINKKTGASNRTQASKIAGDYGFARKLPLPGPSASGTTP